MISISVERCQRRETFILPFLLLLMSDQSMVPCFCSGFPFEQLAAGFSYALDFGAASPSLSSPGQAEAPHCLPA